MAACPGGRAALLALGIVMAGCSSQSEPPPVAEGDEHIACAVSGATQLAEVCSVERAEEEGKLTLVVRHPDGGFRRFTVMTDGSGITMADGADQAETRLVDGKLDVRVGNDRYVFPVTTKAPGP